MAQIHRQPKTPPKKLLMYIKFVLPHGAGGTAAAVALNRLSTLLHKWGNRYNIVYKMKPHKYSVRVTFDNDQHYVLFALTWKPDHPYFANFELVEPMKIDKTK
jgi:hypothetical protein